jgi:hypothetical protein
MLDEGLQETYRNYRRRKGTPNDASSKLIANTIPRLKEGYRSEKRELYPPPYPLFVIEEDERPP